MKKLFLMLTLSIAVIFGMSSCLAEVPGDDTPRLPIVENGFLMFMDIPGSSSEERSGTSTRATSVPAEPGESEVHSLHLLFFSTEGGGFLHLHEHPLAEGETLDMTTPITVDFTGIAALDPAHSHRILVLANIANYLDLEVVEGDPLTEEDRLNMWFDAFRTQTFDQAQSALLSTYLINGIDRSHLLMSSTVERRADQDMVHTSLLRGVVRFDVSMDLPGYTLESVSIWNVPSAPAIWNSNYNIFTSHTERFYGVTVNEGDGRGLIYGFENTVTGSYQGDAFTTCLILGIRSTATGHRTYYRVNVNTTAPDGSGQQVLRRNFVYSVTVSGVRAPGDNTEEDAYRGSETHLDVMVRDWQIDDQGMIMFDGDDILALPTSRVNLPRFGTTADTDPPLNQAGQPVRLFNIFAHSPNVATRLAIANRDLPGGITVGWLDDDPNTKTLWIHATETTSPRNGSVEFTFGSMRAVMEIHQTNVEPRVLNLSVGTHDIDIFEQGQGSVWDGSVQVVSSHPWTATIHNNLDNQNNNIFEFAGGGTVITGDGRVTEGGLPIITGEFGLQAMRTNTAMNRNYAFVIIHHTDDIDFNSVLVLRQDGQAILTADPTEIVFDANGLINGREYIDVDIESSDAAWAVIQSGLHSSHFTAERDGSRVRITSSGRNTMPNELIATVTAFQTQLPAIRSDIRVRQEQYLLELNPAFVPSVAAGGGLSNPMNIVTNIPAGSLSVSITTEGAPNDNPNWAELVREGNQLRVRFPALGSMHADLSPLATITITIAGLTPEESGVPVLTHTVQVRQGQMILRDLYIRTARTAYWGTWHPSGGSAANRATLGRLREEIASRTNFGGPTAVVRSGAHIFSTVTGGALMPTNATDIFLANNVADYNASHGADIRRWVEANPRRVLIVTHETVNTGASHILGYFGFSGFSTGSNGGVHTVAGSAITSNLHAYMFRDGPFANGTDISGSIVMQPADGTGGSVASVGGASSGFIPLMTRGGRITVAINPELRIVYIGEPELFGTRTGATNWNNAANVTFVRNLAAWIVNVAQHGDDFLTTEGGLQP